MEGRIRVVVADDDDRFVGALCTFLQAREDVELVARAYNGREAVEAAERERPDVVLLDLEMPLLDGASAARRIREDGSARHVVLVTGSDEVAAHTAARGAAVDAYVPKTHVFVELIPALRRLGAWRTRSPSADSSSATARSKR